VSAWVEVAIVVSSAQLDDASALLAELGTAGVQEEELEATAPRQIWDTGPEVVAARVRLRAWFTPAERARVDSELRAAGFVGEWSVVPDADWDETWKAAFPPLVVSPRITIAPPWNAVVGALVIEPGQGFGTGQHPSTRACLVAVDELVSGVASVLDVGCGSGILAIAAARLGCRHVRGIDIEEPAIVDARANALRNGVSIEFSTTPIEDVQVGADLVLGNLHAEVLVPMASQLIRVTRRWLVLGGILADREERVRAAFTGLRLVSRVIEDRWVSLRYER
jgi:ribosomal protein L11 methyltransferase